MFNVEIATRNYYSKCKERHYSHPIIHAFSVPKLKWIMSKIRLNNKRVLEIGAGNGYFSNQLMKVCNLTVIDISEHQLKFNPSRAKQVGSVYDLPYKNNSFDIVFSSNLLHHSNIPLKAINEMKRVAKNQIIFCEPNRNNPILFLGALLCRHERNVTKYSKKFIKNLIGKVNMRVKHHSYLGGMVMPNSTPSFLLPFVGAESKNNLSFFQIFICENIR